MPDAPKERRAEFRALHQKIEVRDGEDGGMPTMTGTLAVFGDWAEINSRSEGHFLERIAPTAFNRTIKNNQDQMRVLFEHGKDPQIGNKPLGSISSLEVTPTDVRYEVELLDTSYNRDITQMLSAGVLGSSFRFEALKDDWKRQPGKSDYNPRGLPERVVEEVRMPEFGPCPFPAYAGTSAGLRSLTDEMRGLEQRVDALDLNYLTQMLQLGGWYISEQDESDDAANGPKMQAIIEQIAELVPVEVAEVEPPESDDAAEMASNDDRAVEGDPSIDARDTDRPADHSHPIRLTPRGPDPLYPGRKKEPSWRI